MAREGIDIIHSDGTTETWYATSATVGGTEVEPNPTMSGTETTLDGIGIDGTNYNITDVVANPTLAGTEASLTGLEVDGTKYAVGGGEHLYLHLVKVYSTGSADPYVDAKCMVITNNSTAFTVSSFSNYLSDKSSYSSSGYPLIGKIKKIVDGSSVYGTTYLIGKYNSGLFLEGLLVTGDDAFTKSQINISDSVTQII